MKHELKKLSNKEKDRHDALMTVLYGCNCGCSCSGGNAVTSVAGAAGRLATLEVGI